MKAILAISVFSVGKKAHFIQICSGYNAGLFGVLYVLMLMAAPLYGQSWQSLYTWGGAGNESVEAIVRRGDGAYWVGGGFQGKAQVGSKTWTAWGEEDLYVASYQAGKGWDGVLHLGSGGADVLSVLAAVPSGGFVCGGEFWQLLPLPQGDTLRAVRNPKALFIGHFGAGGQALWAKKIEAGNLKALKGMVLAKDGIYLSGFFSDTLSMDSLMLPSSGSSDAFLIKLDYQGHVLWGRRFGMAGDVRAMALALGPGGPVLAGNFNQRLAVGDSVFVANTRDWDVFIAAFAPNGTLRWARKAGGVYDDEAFDVATGPDGAVYVCGQIVGVMRLGPGLEIQSQDGNADAFILKYRADGSPEWAKTIAGPGVQSGYRLRRDGGELAVAGYYRGALAWAGRGIVSGNAFNGFLALFDGLGNERALVALPGDAPVFPGALETDGQGTWLIGGSYGGALYWDGLQGATPTGGFDAFIAVWGTAVNAQTEPMWASDIRMYPNPARERIWVEVPAVPSPALSLYDLQGQGIASSLGSGTLELPPLPAGLYILEIRSGVEKVWRRVVLAGR